MEEQGNESSPRRRGRRRYPKEFRRDAALVIDQRRTVADVAHQLGVVEQTPSATGCAESASTAA